MKHSPEPWHAGPDNRSPCRVFSREGHDAVALVYLTDPETRKRTPEFAGNVKLIEAAPALFRLLRWVTRCAKMPAPAGISSYAIADEVMDEARSLVEKMEDTPCGG